MDPPQESISAIEALPIATSLPFSPPPGRQSRRDRLRRLRVYGFSGTRDGVHRLGLVALAHSPRRCCTDRAGGLGIAAAFVTLCGFHRTNRLLGACTFYLAIVTAAAFGLGGIRSGAGSGHHHRVRAAVDVPLPQCGLLCGPHSVPM